MQFYTLNQIINLFEVIATNHAQINGFNFGEVSDISASEQEQYPLLWIDVIDSGIESNTLSLNMNVKVRQLLRKKKGLFLPGSMAIRAGEVVFLDFASGR